MASRNFGTLTIDIVAKTGGFEEGMSKAERATEKFNRQTKSQQQELDRLIGKIDPVVGRLSEIDRMEQQLRQHRKKGLLPEDDFQEYNAKLQDMRKAYGDNDVAMGKNAKSAKELQFAMRGMPAQFTDIFTSIQAGQPPLQVFLQQGGQLKDMFGGVGPAARAMGGYIAGLVNPFTVAAGAAIGLAVAYEKGAAEQREFEKTLTMSGNALGVTADQLSEMAAQMDEMAGVAQSKAASALNEVAKAGNFTADQIDTVTKAALKMQEATGQSISDTVEQFASLADEPVAAIVKLNEQQNFLTQDTYEQIRALEESGKTVEAQRLAMDTYADTIRERTTDINGNLGALERSWNAVAKAASESWSAMLNVGREDTLSQRISAVQKQLSMLAETTNDLGNGGAFSLGITKAQSDRQRALQIDLGILEAIRVSSELYSEQQQKQTQQTKENIGLLENAREIHKSINANQTKVNDLLDKRKTLQEAINKTDDEGLAKQYQESIEQIDKEIQKVRESSEAYRSREEAQRKAREEMEQFAKSAQGLVDELYPVEASQERYLEQQEMIRRAYREIPGLSGNVEDALARLERSYRNAGDAAEVYGFDVASGAKQAEEAFVSLGDLGVESIGRVGEEYSDMLTDMLTGTEVTMDDVKRVMARGLAEMATQATLNPIMVGIQGSMTGQTGPNGQATFSNGLNQSMSNITSIGNNVYNGIVDGFGSINWAGNPTSYSGGFAGSATSGMNTGGGFLSNGSMSNFSGVQGLAALPASMAGNYVGGELGSSLTGKEANSNIGATAGAAIGTFFGGPIGAFAGSTLGSFLDSAFGSSPPELDLAMQRGTAESYNDRGNWDEGVRATGAFGTVGLNEDGTHDMNSLWDPAEAQQLFDGIAALDNTLGALAKTPEQLQAMTDAVMASNRHGIQGHYGETSSPENLVDILGSRYKDAIDVLDMATEDFVLAFEGKAEDLVSIASSLGTVESLVGDNAAAMVDVHDALANSDDAVATAQALASQAQAMGLITDSALSLNLKFDEMASGALEAAGNLSELVGGLGNLNALQQQYYSAFYTEQEKFERLSDSLSSTFENLGLALPETDAGVRSLVEGLDLMTQSGREQYATVLQLVPSLEQYIDGLENQAGTAAALAKEERELAEARAEQQAAIADQRWSLENELLSLQGRDAELLQRQRAAEIESIDASNQALQRRIWALEDEQAAQAALADTYSQYLIDNGNVESLEASLKTYELTVEAIDAGARMREEQLRNEMQALETLRDLSDSLLLSNQSILDPLERLQESQRQFAELQVRAESGDTDAASQLSGASSSYLDAAAAYYGQSSSQYASIFGDVTDSVGDLERQFGASVDSLGSLESIEQQALREQQRARDLLMDQLTQQVDMYSQLGSIADLLELLPSSLASSLGSIVEQDSGSSGSSLADVVAGARGSKGYLDDDGARAVYDYLKNTGGSLADVEPYLIDGANDPYEWASRNGLPGFADGGISSGPTSGYPVELHGTEAIIPLKGGSVPVTINGGGNAEMVRELQALRQEVAMLRGERRQDASQAAGQRSSQIREQQKTNRNTKTKAATT